MLNVEPAPVSLVDGGLDLDQPRLESFERRSHAVGLKLPFGILAQDPKTRLTQEIGGVELSLSLVEGRKHERSSGSVMLPAATYSSFCSRVARR